ncbi:hypothetical protein CAPTEDRAFT_201164 [Capitella teleta]|uniref:B box-type domain-containing protein n=1 Tax=Capitella teleta TaxID=283909 RepID=R7VAW9_CAPTE|nr:hypothetical protein CAPTEDRAFT_201164 [Capitella teleta]|eukprot:ELU15744.1 hypothetical protein CAPTEDRAFT_201164 [Capitella teleta]
MSQQRTYGLPALSVASRDHESVTLCQICLLKSKRKKSSYFCLTCSMPLCMMCQEQHKVTEVTSSHQIALKKQQENHPKLCSVHKFANIQYYCDTCFKMICVNCTMIEHKGHTVTPMNKKYEQCQEIIKATRDEINTGISSVASSIQDVEDLNKMIEATREEVKVDINAKVVALQQKIKQQQAQLLRSLNHYFDGKMDALSKRMEVLVRRKDDMAKLREATTRDIPMTSEEVFISHVMQLDSQVKRVVMGSQLPVDDIAGMTFVMTNNEELGRLEEKPGGLEQRRTVKASSFKRSSPSAKRQSGSKSVSALSEFSSGNRKKNGLHSSVGALEGRKWRKVRITHSFKLSNHIEKLVGLALLPNGKLLLADALSPGIIICDKSGKYQQRIMADEVPCPSGLTVNQNGHIVVSFNKTVKTFKLGGAKMSQISAPSTPSALAVDEQGNLFVNDPKSRTVTKFGVDGKVNGTFSTVTKEGSAEASVMGVGCNTVALSYSPRDFGHCVRTFSYSGQLMNIHGLSSACRGVLVDSTGNLIMAAGGLFFASGLGSEEAVGMICVDRAGKPFKVDAHGLAFAANGHLCTLHSNPVSKRSEVLFLQLGN